MWTLANLPATTEASVHDHIDVTISELWWYHQIYMIGRSCSYVKPQYTRFMRRNTEVYQCPTDYFIDLSSGTTETRA